MEKTVNIYDFYKLMSECQVILFYEGLFDQEVVKSIISMTEKKLVDDQVDELLRRRVFNILVEGLQNICKHQTKGEVKENPFLVIARDINQFNVIIGNPIADNKIELVTGKIDFVNSLNREELKEFYKKARLNSVISEVGGAGLGFIDMARKSGHKLQYGFYPLSNGHSLFILNNTISNN